MQRGKFIVIEGPDGSGTTRHSALLAERLRREGCTVLLTNEPTESGIGQDIRGILRSGQLPSPAAMQLLFCADRAEHVATVIEPALAKGSMVICDRYTLSTLIYGAAMGLNIAWLRDINAEFPIPDLMVVTLPPYEICRERIDTRANTDHFERDALQRMVYERYKTLEDPNSIFVDTSGPKKDVAEQVFALVAERIHPIPREKATGLR